MRRKWSDWNKRGETEKQRNKKSGTRIRKKKIERQNERRKRRGRREWNVIEETSRGNNTRERSTCVLLSIIYWSAAPMFAAYLLESLYAARCVLTVKNPPCRGGTVRCFFLDGKCRRHKCLFDLMTRCPTRARVATHTREHLSPSLRSFRVSVGHATEQYTWHF